ncbi:uncharacterized protein LOC119746392 [Patiria miniata]|uniref:protein-tyrosine-phosphatase n=1 Tax=Patiria miniata TaxID=46514 RepID=A0A914BTZ9_PATMI|nr:uncharacterized protein LOC119746392 [Patiria miniata]
MGRHHLGSNLEATLLVFLGLCSVAALQTIRVSNLAVAFNDATNVIKEGSAMQMFDLEVSITLASNSEHADANGVIDRWSLTLAVQDNAGTACVTGPVTLTAAQSGVAIRAGGLGTMRAVSAKLDLTSCLCSSATQLKVTLGSTRYTLDPAMPSGTGSLDCHGLAARTLTVITAGANLIENVNDQPVTLTIVGNSESQGRSVGTGTNANWAVQVFIANGNLTHYTPIESTRADATVPPAEAMRSWAAGDTLTIIGVTTMLNLTGVGSCDTIDVLCSSLYRDPSATNVFSVDGGNIVSCTPVICIGVLINQVIPAFTQATTIDQGKTNPNIPLTVTIKADDTKASVSGTGLWNVNVFGNANANCMNPTRVPGTATIVQGVDYGLDVNHMSVWPLITVSLNMGEHSCTDAEYICVEVLKGSTPAPPFSLSFSPEFAKYGSVAVECIALIVSSGTLSVNAATHLAAFKEDHMMLFSVTFMSSASSGGAGGTDLWELVAFPAQNADGSGRRGPDTTVPLTSGELNTAFPGPSGSLTFNAVTATISLASNPCNTYSHLCAQLRKNANANPDFLITSGVIVCSAVLTCQNVILTSTTVSPSVGASPNGLPLYEGVSGQEVFFDVVAASDSTAGSVPSGSNHWQFDVSLGTSSATAALTQAQRDATLTAGTDLAFTRVMATLDLSTQRCDGIGNLCAEIVRSSADTLGFLLDSPQAQNMGCFTPTCQGVEITSLVINDGVTNFDLKEGTQGHAMTFSVDVTTNGDAGSVRGSNLWKMLIYLSADNTYSNLVEARDVTGAWASQDVLAGATTTLTDVQVTLNLDTTCANMQLLCVELAKADGQTFILDPARNVLQTCKPVPGCNGIEIDSVSVALSNGGLLVEGVASNAPEVDISLTFTDTSASVTGTNIWNVTIYGSNNEAGLGTRMSEQRSVTSGNTAVGETRPLDSITWNVDMTNRLCVDVTHICVGVELVTGASVSLIPNSNLKCSEVPCEGIVITAEQFRVSSGGIFEAMTPQTLAVDQIRAQAKANGAVIPDNMANIWDVALFLNSAMNGSGTTYGGMVNPTGSLPTADQRKGINSSAPLMITTVLNFEFTQNVLCGSNLYVCLEISERTDAIPDYDITFPPDAQCNPISCTGVVFVSANLMVPADTKLIENEPAHPVRVTFQADTAAVTATLDSGTNFWTLKVFANTQANGTGAERYGETEGVLSSQQLNLALAASSTIELSDIDATLNLNGFVCPSDMIYLCAELQRNPNSVPPFTIQGMPSPLIACELVECQGVLITSIDIAGAPPAVIESERNDMTLTVTVGVGGADASGTNLWRMEASLVDDNGMELATVDVNLGDQANSAVVAGQPITFSDLPVPFDLTNRVCPDNGTVMLCIELSRGGSANTDFTVTGVTRQCLDLPCKGVVIVQSAISASTGSLLEGRASNPITLDVSYTSDPNGASISGTNLWSVTVFGNNQEDGSGDRLAVTVGTLQGNDNDFPLSKGDTVEFNRVAATLDLSPYRVCEDVHWVCAELKKGASPSKNFSLTDTNNARIACTSLACTGVQISNTVLTINNVDLTEDSGVQQITVTSLVLTGAPGTSALPDTDASFKVVIFGNSMEDTSGPKVAQTTLDVSFSSQGVNPDADTSLNNPGTASLNLTDVFCTDLQYLCVKVYRGDSPPYNFKLEGVPNENSLLDCTAVTCRGVRVTGGMVDTMSVLREGNPAYPMTVRVDFTTDVNGASVRSGGTDLFQLKAFLADSATGGGIRGPDQNVTLPGGSASQPVTAGGDITFVDAVATLDTTTWTCQTENFLCLRLSKGPAASRNYLLEGWDGARDDTKLLTCTPITCRGVNITDVVFEVDGELSFEERDPSATFTFDLGLVADPEAGGVTGTGLWNLTVALNSMWDGSGESFGETVVVLSPENANRAIDPTGPRTNLTDVQVTLPLDGVQCSAADPFYLCVKIDKADGSSPDFTLTVDDWHCTMITCYSVRISGLSFEVDYPDTILENEENNLRVNLNVTTDALSANISGTGLWASPWFQIRNAANTSRLDSSEEYWTQPLASMALEADDTTEFVNIFPVKFTPNGMVCSDLTQLCMTFAKGASPDPEFDLEFLTPSDVCVDIECRGVEIMSTVITNITEGGTVTERITTGQLVVLSVSSTSAADGASITGSDLWALTVYYTPNANGDVDATIGSAEMDLTPDQLNTDLSAGQDLELTNVAKANVDLSNLVCPETGLYLCVKLKRHANPSPLFTLSAKDGDQSALIGCKSVECIGVQIEETTLGISNGMLIPVEKPAVHTVDFRFSSTPSIQSAAIFGTGLWKMKVFANRRMNGTHQPPSYMADVTLTTSQMNAPVIPGLIFQFSSRSVTLNLQQTDTECRETQYFCGQLLKGDTPSPPFSLQGVPDDNRLINCVEMDCNGVKITTFDLTNTGGDILRENQDGQLFSFDVSLTSDANKTSVSGVDLWTFKAFLNNAQDCLGDAAEVALTPATVNTNEEDQDLAAGGTIDFNVAASMNYRMKCPDWDNVYVCLEVFRGDVSSVPFTLFGDILKGVPIVCRGVEVTQTEISRITAGSLIVESDDDVTFDLNLEIRSVAAASGISGTGLWSVDVFLSDEPTCQTETSDRMTSPLSLTNRNKDLVAGAVLLMNNVGATIRLQGLLCEDIRYVCVALGKGLSPTPDFTLVPVNGNSSLIDSQEIECRGLHIVSSELSVTNGEPLISNDPGHPVSFNLIFNTHPDGASIASPTNLFRLQVAATASPDRAGVEASQHQVIVPYSPPPGFTISAGQRYTLPVDANLNLRGARCDEIPYICVTMMKGVNPVPPFTLTPDVDDPVVTACSERLDCVGVRIVNQQLTIQSGIPFVEHAMSNPVEMTVRLTSGDNSGDALGINLWSAEVKLSADDPLAPGTEFFAVTTGTFVGSDADTDLYPGETIAMRLEANMNLTGVACSDVRFLVVNITNPDADPEFTIQWTDDVEYVVISQSFTCSGVYLQYPSPPGSALVVSDGFPLKELAAASEVVFTVNIDVTPQSATIMGQDLWKVRAFVSPTSNGNGIPEDVKEDAVLTSVQGAVPIVASATSTLTGVEVSLDTSDKYCSDMTYLCVEVWRGDSAQPFYSIESPGSQAELRTCVQSLCNGVVIMEVMPTIVSIPPLIEMRPNQVVSLDVNVTATPNSAGIDGDNLWAATVFVSSQPDGSGATSSVREATIDPTVQGRDLVPDSVLTLEDLVATMDFSRIACSEMRYICVTLRENGQAQPDFNLAGDLTSCIETNCISVAIASGALALASNEVLEGDDLASFSLDISFTPWSNSHSLQEDDSWTLFAYTTDRGDGLGSIYALNQVTLTQDQQNQAVNVGTPLVFNARDVTLDLTTQSCDTTSHFCVVLGTQPGAFVLGGYPTSTSLVACAELLCSPKEVDLYSVEVTERRIAVEFTEAFGDFDLYVLTYSPMDGITTSPYPIPRNLPRALTFDQLVPGQEYTIELVLRDGADEKAGPFTLVERTRPDPVVLQLGEVTSSELTVSWDAATGIFDHYTIVLDPADNGLPRSPVNVFPAEDREVTFTGLLTARQYNVTIYTVSGNVQSLPSSVVAITDPSTPVLITTGNDETSIDLEWFISESYNVDQYEVRHQPDDGMPQPIVFPGNLVPRRATLENLTPGRRYVITLVAVSNIGGMTEIRSVPAEVTVQLLPMAPAEITYQDPTETSIQIEWPMAVGELDYYRVIFSPSANLAEMIVPENSPRELLFQGLDVASEYTVTITTHIAGINGELVSRPVTRTVYTLPYPPGPLTIVQVTTTQIEFQWADAQGPRDGYEVTFDPNEAEFDPQSPYFTTGTSMLLTGIKPHVTVDFEVRTKIGDVVSRPQTLRQRTFPTLPGQVRDFQITGYDSDNIQISFRVPESPNGLILAYLVTVEGTKPGEPSESAFQTINALPNDVQFEEIISPLKAGYTYTLSIQAINTEGAGEPVVLSPLRLPIKEPYYQGQQTIDEFILDVTSSTISLRIPRSLFSDRNGIVTSYSILVVEEGADRTASANPPNYQTVRNNAVKPVYVTINRAELFSSSDNRRRRQADVAESARVVIGDQTPCPNNDDYCNGPLDSISQYRVSIRAYTEEGLYTDTPWSKVIATKSDIWWFIYVLIPFAIIVLIIAFIMCLCCCIANDEGDRRQPEAKRGREKAPLAETQLNENSSNNVSVAAVATPEPLAPAPAPAPAKPRPQSSRTSRPIAVVKFGQHVSKMSAKTGDNFAKEFEDLNLIGETHAKTVGALPENEDKNRYGNIVPFDFNRVRLDKDDDYINASFMSGFTGAKEYIAAQGPQANSVNDFWQMIWEQKAPTIAVIGTCVEKERVKFAQYWPSDSTPITFGEVTVNRVSEREETDQEYIVRDLCLESGSEVRALRQYQFTAWPVHGVPKKSDQMLNFIRTVRAHLLENSGPLVVHCGAGIGRTGVFIALDVLTQQLALDEEYIDVFGTVAAKREERTNMVQTELQYEFVHKALLDIIEGRVTGPKRRASIDTDQRVEDIIAEIPQ